MIAPTVLTRRTIATQIHLLPKTRRSTGRRYRSTRAITSSVICATANTPRATRPHTGTEVNNESITYALSPRHLAHHAKSDGSSGRHGCIEHFVPPPEPRPLAATNRPAHAEHLPTSAAEGRAVGRDGHWHRARPVDDFAAAQRGRERYSNQLDLVVRGAGPVGRHRGAGERDDDPAGPLNDVVAHSLARAAP